VKWQELKYLVPEIDGKSVLMEMDMVGTKYCRYGNSEYSRKHGWNRVVMESDRTMRQAGIGTHCKVLVLH
jgi:hypothetical protein